MRQPALFAVHQWLACARAACSQLTCSPSVMAVLAKGHTHHELYRASQTYTSSLAGFANAVEIGLNCSGNRFGVGLSAAAVPCNVNGSASRLVRRFLSVLSCAAFGLCRAVACHAQSTLKPGLLPGAQTATPRSGRSSRSGSPEPEEHPHLPSLPRADTRASTPHRADTRASTPAASLARTLLLCSTQQTSPAHSKWSPNRSCATVVRASEPLYGLASARNRNPSLHG
jgi:hypothetical protein